MFFAYMTNFTSVPWQSRDRVLMEAPACLSDPKYGKHKFMMIKNVRQTYKFQKNNNNNDLIVCENFRLLANLPTFGEKLKWFELCLDKLWIICFWMLKKHSSNDHQFIDTNISLYLLIIDLFASPVFNFKFFSSEYLSQNITENSSERNGLHLFLKRDTSVEFNEILNLLSLCWINMMTFTKWPW